MFRQIVERIAQNMGREHYEHIVALFGKMVKIEGGRTLVKEMINQFRNLYKNRRAMMEILMRFEKEVFTS
jgi:hypothetical protein